MIVPVHTRFCTRYGQLRPGHALGRAAWCSAFSGLDEIQADYPPVRVHLRPRRDYAPTRQGRAPPRPARKTPDAPLHRPQLATIGGFIAGASGGRSESISSGGCAISATFIRFARSVTMEQRAAGCSSFRGEDCTRVTHAYGTNWYHHRNRMRGASL